MQHVAIVGASRDRRKFGNKAVRAYAQAGHEVYPVHPREEEIEGLRVYPAVGDIPVDLDRISVYVPPAVTLRLLPGFAATNAGEVWFNPGAADRRVVDAAREAGLNVREGCSIIDIGASPSDFD